MAMNQVMENRRLEGRDRILKKLRGNQDFLMQTTLSPKAPVWTKWHQERMHNNEMERDTSANHNSQYVAIIREVVEKQLQPKLLEWAMGTTLSDNSKKVSTEPASSALLMNLLNFDVDSLL